MILCVRAALVLAILAYWPAMLEQFESPKAAVVRVLGCGLLAATLAGMVVGRKGPRRSWQPLDVCMAAWLLVEIASTGMSVAPTISLFGDTEQQEGLLTSLGIAGLYAATRFATVDAASARRTLLVTLGAIAAACAVALWQLASFDRVAWENAPTYLGWYRPFGSLGHANLLGAMAAAALTATLGLAASRMLGRWWWVAAGLLFGATTVLTLSRAAWLAAGAGVVAVLALRAGHGRPLAGRPAMVGLAAGAVAMLALVVLIGPLRARVLELVTLGSGSGSARLEIWKTAIAMWLAHPWLGSGPGTFQLLFGRHQTPTYWLVEWGATPFHAHSIYLQALATRGIAGVLTAGAVLGAAVFCLVAGHRKDAAGRGLVPAVAALLLTLGVAGASGALGIAGAALVACTLGALPSLAPQRAPARGQPTTRTPRWRVPLLAGGLAALLTLLPTVAQLRGSRAAFLSRQQEEAWRAIAEARRAVQLVPWSDVLAAHCADVLRQRSSSTPDPRATLTQAEGYARRAIQLAPLRLYNQSELALLLLPHGGGRAIDRERQAAAAIERCTTLAPYNIMPLINYSEVALRLGRGDLALPVVRRAIAVYPGEALPRAVLGEVYLAMGESEAARAAMEQSLTLEWRDRARRERAERLLAELREGRHGGFVLGRP